MMPDEAEIQDRPSKRAAEHGGAFTRLSVNLSPSVAQALRVLTQRHQTSITEEVRKAISIWKFLDDEQLKGAQIVVESADGKARQLVL